MVEEQVAAVRASTGSSYSARRDVAGSGTKTNGSIQVKDDPLPLDLRRVADMLRLAGASFLI